MAVAALACAAALGACGGGSKSIPSGPRLGVTEAQWEQIVAASNAISASNHATSYLTPSAVAHSQQLLRPLTVAGTLKVGASDPTAGGLVSNLFSDLDGTTPGLTTGNGGDERLDPQAVNRFLKYGKSNPRLVFQPKAASGVASLERLLRGMRAATVVIDTTPAQTAGGIVSRAVADSAPWPDLTHRLVALRSSLR